MLMKRLGSLLTLVLALSFTCPVQADFDAGLEAYEAEDYDTAYNEWLPLAEAGNPRAQFAVGDLIYSRRYRDEAVDWWSDGFGWISKAAEQGHANAEYWLARHFMDRPPVDDHYETALMWMRRAAHHGHVLAMDTLARLLTGTHTGPRLIEAMMWTLIAQDRGLPPSRADSLLNFMRDRMSGEEIAQAERRAADLLPTVTWWDMKYP